jgi:hypothetical protein
MAPSNRKYAAFDLEIAFLGPPQEESENNEFLPSADPGLAPPGDWHLFRPFGITCAAMAWEERGAIQTRPIYGKEINKEAGKDGPSPRMTQDECQTLVKHLQQVVDNGFTILTWNGLGFDFDVLGEESGMVKECAMLALNHVDMMFHFFCLQGYPLGLDKAAKGMGLGGKSVDVSGAAAPQLWADGYFTKVLDYVQQDVRTTLEVAQATESAGGVSWTARSGKLKHVRIPQWRTAEDCLMHIRVPNNSWMDDPWPRTKFSGWAIGALDAIGQPVT